MMEQREVDERSSISKSEDLKCYEFEAEISAILRGCVYAHSVEEAMDLIEQGKNDDIEEIYDKKIENIVDIKLAKEDD